MWNLVLCLLTILTVSSVNSEVQSHIASSQVTPNASSAIDGREEAIAKARLILGIDDENRVALADEQSADRIVAVDSLTPFLNEQIDGKDVWRIVFADIEIYADSSSRVGTKSMKRKFEVWLDAGSGRLLRVYAPPLRDDTTVWPEPSAKSAERKLRESQEVYHGFPDSLPSITFFEALTKASGCAPAIANEIIAQLVIHSRFDQEPRPVWCITCRGIPPVVSSARSKEVSEKYRNRARCVVDARTGEWLYMTTTPQVEPPIRQNGE